MNINLIEGKDVAKICDSRKGENKIGENCFVGSDILLDDLAACPAPFVIFGIPEDVGPRANCGRGGSASAWDAFLGKFLNIQENQFLSGKEILILGSLDCSEYNKIADKNIDQLCKAVEKIDVWVTELVQMIVSANKIPIIIGGGHNNSYGAIKGNAKALKHSINCINLDPHADYRALEGRHSGNGFSYAKKEGFLDEYAVLGLHENYNSAIMLQEMQNDKIHHLFFEDIFIRENIGFTKACKQLLSKVNTKAYGVELDCDAIQDFPTSAQTPSGVSAKQARQYVSWAAASKNACYLHLPEAAPSLVEGSAAQVGKLLAYLVSDFVKERVSFEKKEQREEKRESANE